MFSTAALAAPEWTIPGIPLCGDRVTLRTFPDSWGMNALVAAAWVISQVPSTLSSITVLKPFGEIASAGLRNCPPALLTSTSTRPWRSTTPSKSESTASSSRMSIATASASPASGSIAADRLLERLQPAAAADHRRAEPGKLERRLAAEARAGAGDHADPALEQSGRKDSRGLGRHGAGRLYVYSGGAMKVRADTKPLDGPLPGGTEGASVVVEPILTGTVRQPRAAIEQASQPPDAAHARARDAEVEADGPAGARVSGPPSDRRRLRGRHRPARVDRRVAGREPRPAGHPDRAAGGRARRGPAAAASRLAGSTRSRSGSSS